jgi:hypothetical protein
VKSKLAWAGVIGGAVVACLGGDLAAAHGKLAEANPYAAIWDRNIFHLNPMPLPPPPAPPKPPQRPTVMLTGLVGKGRATKVYLAILPTDSKEAPYYTRGLLPGEKEHDVELVNIRLDKEEVEIVNSGTLETLSVESNSFEAVANSPHKGGGEPAMAHGGPPGMPPRMPRGLHFPQQPRG